MNPREFIDHLRSDNESFYGDERGRGALKDLQVVFPVSWIYLAELVQNAIDAEATRLRFVANDSGELVFEHDGKPFSAENVRALCLRGVSTKSTNTVGFMGVGFKSVFKAYETVTVSSGEWQFRISVGSDDTFGSRLWIGAVLPTWAPDANTPSDGYLCRFQFSRRLIDGAPYSDLAELLRDDEALLPLLGWNGVTDFAVGNNTWHLSKSETSIEEGDASRVRIEASSADEIRRAWILFIKSYQPSERAVTRFLRHRQIQAAPEERESILSKAMRIRDVSLFCELSPDGSPRPVSRGQCFSLVPTGQTTCLGLHMQADWLLDISRREPMKIANDPWQEEILAQVPHLMRSYLDWLVSDETDDADAWAAGYAALPGPSENSEIDAAVHGSDLAEQFYSTLENGEFIPYAVADQNIEFASPKDARILPESLQRAMAGNDPVPIEVLGRKIVVADLLGARAIAFLKANRLLATLTPDELEQYWNAGTLETWYKERGGTSDAGYVRLIAGLAELDSDVAWAAADLRCLPAASGAWRARRWLTRYPPNWTILAPSPMITAALEPFVGMPDDILDLAVDLTLRRDAAAQRYLRPLAEPTLEQVAQQWWAGLAEEVDQPTRELAIEFTELVRRQKTLPRLVSKVLAIREDGERLLQIDHSLLADPYAGEYRRTLFSGLPAVSPAYLASSEEATDADWRTFFEDQKPAPKGRPTLALSRRSATDAELASLSAIPPLRVTWFNTIWNNISIDSNRHYVVDAQWPAGVEPVASNAKPAHALALQRSMLEMPGVLRTWRRLSLVYIASKSSVVSLVGLPAEAAWLVALRERAWVFDQDGRGPFRISELLSSPDASRPNAPVARLADGFAALANEFDLAFGGAIPNAPAIERLRTFGASASWSELHDLLKDAISEAEDDSERLALLRTVLNTTSLFSLPEGRTAPDGQQRVPGRRVVNGSRRSTLADWVCSIESFADEGLEQTVLKQLSAVVKIPEATTGEHAASFLRWVWNTTPDADRVRQILPRAYQYALDLSDESRSTLPANAKVFVTARRWVAVAGGSVFLNDLEVADRDLLTADQDIALATPGHLGEDDETRRLVCELIGLQLASTHYSLRIEDQVGDAITPDKWKFGFWKAQETFAHWIAGTGDDQGASPQTLEEIELVCVDTVTTRLLKDGTELYARPSMVAIRDGRAHVVGEPQDFASELAPALIEHWGLTLRHDGYSLGARLTGLLARLDMTVSEPDPTVRPPEINRSDPPLVPPKGPHAPPGTPATPPTTHGAEKRGAPSHTGKQKDALHDWLLKKHLEVKRDLKRIEQQIAEGLGAEVVPIEDAMPGGEPRKPFGEDKEYRDAAVEYETNNGRFATAADSKQAGYDIDSYSHDVGHPDRVLVRRIEVKGKGALWSGDEIVELSDRQLKDAIAQRVDSTERVAPDFDYWLYVVETDPNGLWVLPILNPARRAAKFEFRGGVWRSEAEKGLLGHE